MKLNELFPLQVYINLDSRIDRKLQAEEEFKRIGIQPDRISGQIFNGTNSKWWNGAIGCLLSHVLCLQMALKNNSNIMIFEDDVSFLGDNSLKTIETACDELSQFDWKMFYLGGNILKPFYQVSQHLAKLNHCQSTVSYSVNINFVEELLKHIGLPNITAPIDVIYANKIIPVYNAYIAVPMCTIQRKGYSDIEDAEVNYPEYLERRYNENIVRGKF